MLKTYHIKVAGLEYIGQYSSACLAIIAAIDTYGTHGVTARKVSR